MKLAELDTDTIYLVGARGYGQDPGIVLDTTPWESRRDRHARREVPTVYAPSPDGKGFGVTSKLYGTRRGLFVLTTSRYGDDAARRVSRLPKMAALVLAYLIEHHELPVGVAAPAGYKLEMYRPQDIVTTWAEHVEAAGRDAVAKAERETRTAAKIDAHLEARGRIATMLGPSVQMPYADGPEHRMPRVWLDFAELETLMDTYARRWAASLPPLERCAVRPAHHPHVFLAVSATGADLGERTCPGQETA